MGQDDGELAHGPVGPVGPLRLAHPDLEAVAQEVVRGGGIHRRLGGGVVLVGGGQAHIVLGQDALPFPNAAVGIELQEAQVILRGGPEAAAPHLHAVGHFGPAEVRCVDADLIEEAGLQIVVEAQARLGAHDGPQEGGAGGIVHIGRAGLVVHGGVQEFPDPILAGGRHGVHPAAHAQHVPHGEELQIVAGLLGAFVGEDIDDPLIQAQDALGVGDAHRRGGIGLGVALEPVADIGAEGGPPALGAKDPVTHDHEAVHLRIAGLQIVQIGHNVFAADAQRLRRSGLKGFAFEHGDASLCE